LNRKELLDRVYAMAFTYEKENRGCAQSVLAALQDVFDLKNDDVFRSASALSGGVGLSTHGTCGALSGGVMAIGMMFGRERSNFKDPGKIRMISYGLAKRLTEKFEDQYGSIICYQVQRSNLGRSFDLWSSIDYADFEKVAYRQEKCPHLVGMAAAWAAEIILDEKERSADDRPEQSV
jgi:C_GCAxxG_C_C family probable redox protein